MRRRRTARALRGRPNTCKILIVNGQRRKLCFDRRGRITSNSVGGQKRKR